ncbi:sigma-54-dependent transcriptional regulator [Marinomonas mediterranea]|jgi:Two-component response regulator CbrB|uniref:Putative two component, sigma54 specific, transcriptional regulator n=1 Tax=Marinomonas mediterranea (strain ATCC 700492 / JCM 21426 / NBRC 103028 / MMB-1) TaxID=717774 RepID=F2JV61_MARM1|nr:sigma-54 dependent transcriptional regulator [Marinomonas mediterranea]ADZ92819.1 putative two component, sigma54 specific, transcriptional regulator [Marinomonas mediterranea MMB-1]WCN10752.1 AAA domain-containing protein [Marinomonas mediterranea]WCN14809.1 AAA domain-containing protein [Marinomonas mediterranea]WCN18842.1 AAA domain-containing protein [Marinomonas mediterranea MMB-1]
MHHIMIICPEASELIYAEKWLSRNGFHVNVSHSVSQANKYYELSDFDLILLDTSSLEPLEIDNTLKHPCIVFDDKASLSTAVNLMAKGALYYLSLPSTADQILNHVIDALERPKTLSLNSAQSQNKEDVILFPLSPEAEESRKLGSPESGIIGQSPKMQSLFKDIRKVAPTDVTVLVRGESGTGKELVAKALHNLSSRHAEPLISVNCAAIPENLIESELFGHEKGAFTGAASARDGLVIAADNGTLFLDEIGELPLEAQARLLRVLQEGEIRRVGAVQSTKVNIRLVTATHRNLKEMVRKGQFREDLYYRLYVMELILPPLRDRGDDLSLIAKTLLRATCEKYSTHQYEYSKAFDKAIRSHSWPGNVRELENAIERAVILSPNSHLEPQNLKLESLTESKPSNETTGDNSPSFSGTTLDDYLKHFVLSHQQELTETEIAQSLGISRKSLWERRQKLGIPKKVTADK